MIRWLSRPGRGKPALLIAIFAALLLGLSACGSGGDSTVTVTETVGANQSQQRGSNQTSRDEVVTDGAVAGYVDAAKAESDSLVLSGWAAAADLSEPATQVVAEVEGETMAEAIPAIAREDVVEALGESGLAESGFELQIPLESLDCEAPAAGVKVVGSLNGESGVLSYGEGVKQSIADAC